MIFTIFCVFVLIFFVATVIYVMLDYVFGFDVVKFLNSLIKFAGRGFDNTEKITFNVNEQITLGGDISYFITKNTYLGKSKKPISVEYCRSYYDKHLDNLILLNPLKYEKIKEETIQYGFSLSYDISEKFNSYTEAIDVCLQLKEEHDRISNWELQQQEEEKLKEVVQIITYEI